MYEKSKNLYKKEKRKFDDLVSNESSDEELIEKFSTMYRSAKRICKSYVYNYKEGMLIEAIKVNDIENVHQILKYCNKDLIVSERDEGGRYPFYHSVTNNNMDMTKMIIYYAKVNEKKLNINEKGPNEWYPFLIAVSENNIEMAQTIIDYAIDNGIKLEINAKHKGGWYPILYAAYYNNTEMVNLILDYATKENITLDIIDNKDPNGWYPLLFATNYNNNGIVKSILDYPLKIIFF